MAKRKSTASKTVASAMRRRKSGTLKSGSGGRVRSRKQAIAIGLNEAREKGAKVPARRGSSRKRASGAKRARPRAAAKSTSGSRARRRSSSGRAR